MIIDFFDFTSEELKSAFITIKKKDEIYSGISRRAPWYDKLKILRILKEWNIEEAAEQCQVVREIYSLWENGVDVPVEYHRKIICEAFEVTEWDLFGLNPLPKTFMEVSHYE